MENENYEEHSFSLADFGKQSHRARNIIIGVVIALVVITTLFLVFTAQGRAWLGGGAAIVGKSFTDATGIMSPGGTSHEVAVQDVSSDSSNSDMASGTVDAMASDTVAQTSFPTFLPPTPVKSTAKKKTTKKTSVIASASPNAISPFLTALADDSEITVDNVAVSDTTVGISKMSTSVSSDSPAIVLMKNILPPVFSSSQSRPVPLNQIYPATIMIAGDGRGFVTSTPVGIACDGTGTCTWNFLASRTVSFRASHDMASSFGGWTGACTGSSPTCTVTVHGPVDVTATFRAKAVTETATPSVLVVGAPPVMAIKPIVPPVVSSPSDEIFSPSVVVHETSSVATPATMVTQGAFDHIIIGAVQIAGDASTNDFVVIHNVTVQAIDVGGWRLRKKSSSGVDYSIRTFSAGTTVAAGAEFVWANSAGGFSDSIHADLASTQTLAGDNSVALFDANGILIDAVAWGGGSDQYGEGIPFPDNPAAGQSLVRRLGANGVMVDTNENAKDFILQ